MHRDLIERFGGNPGLRDVALLESALAQPEATFGGELLHPTIEAQAAAYLFHLCSNHAFIDGNKRVAFAAMDTFLRINGKRLTLTDDEAYDLTIRVARGELNKDEIASVIERATSDSPF
jgi:death-on-curing protein